MEPIDYAILSDKSTPIGVKDRLLKLVEFFCLGFIFALFQSDK